MGDTTNLFKCPTCGAPLEPPAGATTMKCGYCSNSIIIPESVRSGVRIQGFEGGMIGMDLKDLTSQAKRLKEVRELALAGNKIEAIRDMWWLNRVGFTTGRYMPWLLWQIPIWFFYRKGASKPADVMERGADSRPEADALLWEDPAIRNVCYASTVEAFRQGTRGQAWDVRLISRQWGFRLEDIHVPVFLWHGEADRDTPVTMGRYVASKIPNCRATICVGEAHMLIFPHWEEILQSLISL